MKIYDCFIFNNEFDILDLRLNILNDIVDKFILVESSKTHSGKNKPFHFYENQDRFKDFLHKIHVVKVDVDSLNLQNTMNAWVLEHSQRNQIQTGLNECNVNDEDLIIVSDVDEIPDPKFISSIKASDDFEKLFVFKQKLYYYYLNCAFKEEDINYNFLYNTRISQYGYMKKRQLTPHLLRVCFEGGIFLDAGWHFSFIGDSNFIKSKIESFAHTELDQEQFKELSTIDFNKDNAKDIFGRTFQFEFVNIDDTFPDYIINNQDKLKDMIKEL